MQRIWVKIKLVLDWLKSITRKWLLLVFLSAVYFGLVTPCAIIWRRLLRRSLFWSRAAWVNVSESAYKPNVIVRSVGRGIGEKEEYSEVRFAQCLPMMIKDQIRCSLFFTAFICALLLVFSCLAKRQTERSLTGDMYVMF